MNHSEILIVVAECGVALAGFASLISVFGSSKRTLDFTRLLGMVKYGLTAAAFSLLPFAPHVLGASESIVWRGSAVVFFAVHTTDVLRSWSALARLRRGGSVRIVRASYFTYPAGVVSMLLTLATILTPNASIAAGLYVCALLVVLVSAGVLFLSLFGSFIRANIRRNDIDSGRTESTGREETP
jgi:hypothetical protein